MEIKIDKNLVELKPGTTEETEGLEKLWRLLVDCMRKNRKMVPVGEYVPGKENLARFYIEELPGGQTEWSTERAPKDEAYYCATCNKYMNVKKGAEVPKCCGREMEAMD
ncbi:hypothetical protein [Desulfurivibrio alkaliphilus]|uniref:Uncharacterized protein n=1 Tax=Desulfurivibrio alkaliphilus (strain DSM 19089 / UNIQEM U267 / AHT2) TaxID=589865 RepID=D6Z5R2_DESAT|nr:hypothetical protein [Desulfurivibrio alkaliphilus]ADH86799.1 hypothetical protein DaAHT2_2128 [Desulfurivibrio alkaliphilus AHT 2]